MKYKYRVSLSLLTLLSFHRNVSAQTIGGGRQDKLYTMSGFGFSLPVGQSNEVMRPKFSTSIGVNLGIGDGGLFLYPKLSLHVFGYDSQVRDEYANYELQQGRSTTYLVNVALGYRKIIKKLAFYGFMGAGGGYVLTPRVMVNEAAHIAVLNNKTNRLGLLEPGAGIEYNIGGANLFAEGSYMCGLGKIGNRHFAAVPLSIGIKPNLSKLFK